MRKSGAACSEGIAWAPTLLDYFEPWNRYQAYIAVSALIHVKTARDVAAASRGLTIPIVPDETGAAHSLAKPGKNVPGNTSYAGARVRGVLLQLLLDAKALTLVKVGPAQS